MGPAGKNPEHPDCTAHPKSKAVPSLKTQDYARRWERGCCSGKQWPIVSGYEYPRNSEDWAFWATRSPPSLLGDPLPWMKVNDWVGRWVGDPSLLSVPFAALVWFP